MITLDHKVVLELIWPGSRDMSARERLGATVVYGRGGLNLYQLFIFYKLNICYACKIFLKLHNMEKGQVPQNSMSKYTLFPPLAI